VPVPGQPRNPFGQAPDRFDLEAPRFAVKAGETPGTMGTTTRGMILAGGQIRELWRQALAYLPGPPGYSWTANRSLGDLSAARGFQITRALRYLTRGIYFGGGSDNTRFAELHTIIPMSVKSKPVTVAAGSVRGTPVTRNRLTSFGSRVLPLQDRPSAAVTRQR